MFLSNLWKCSWITWNSLSISRNLFCILDIKIVVIFSWITLIQIILITARIWWRLNLKFFLILSFLLIFKGRELGWRNWWTTFCWLETVRLADLQIIGFYINVCIYIFLYMGLATNYIFINFFVIFLCVLIEFIWAASLDELITGAWSLSGLVEEINIISIFRSVVAK